MDPYNYNSESPNLKKGSPNFDSKMSTVISNNCAPNQLYLGENIPNYQYQVPSYIDGTEYRLRETMSKRNMTFIRQSLTDNSNEIFNSEIFRKSCDPENFQKGNKCEQCGKKGSLLKKTCKNCHFCGAIVCLKCIAKKRQLPEVKVEMFKSICRKCEKLYIQKYIYDEFITEHNEVKAKILLTEKEYKEQEMAYSELTAYMDYKSISFQNTSNELKKMTNIK